MHGSFLLALGRPYWDGVFAYHLHKPNVGGGTFAQELLLMLRKSSFLVAAVPASVAVLWRGSARETFSRARLADEPRVQLAAFALASLAATLLFVAATRAVFHYYFVMLMVGVAPLAGLAYGELLRRVATLVREVRAHGAGPAARLPGLTVAALLVWPLAGTALARLPAARRTQVPDDAVGHPAARTWRPSPVLGPVDGAVHALLWRDEEILGRRYPIWTRFLWDASQTFEMAEIFARYADRLPPDATLFGEPALVDAVALMSGRRVALEEADTNFMRFRSGITPASAFIARLRAAPPAFIVFPIGDYLTMGDEFHRWMETDYEGDLANDSAGIVYTVMRPRAAKTR